MTQLFEVPEADVTCPNSKCLRKNCDRHCWSCGRRHDAEETGTPICLRCEMLADQEAAPIAIEKETTGLTYLGIQEDLGDDED